MNILKFFKKNKQEQPKTSEKSERFEVIISGSGGQGMILGGRIFAEAATLYDNKIAVMSQSYGPEARGGASRAEIIISTSKINYPKVMKADVLLAMTQEALDKYGKLLGSDNLLIVDETLVKKIPSHFKNVFMAPFNSLAINVLDKQIVANVIALGSLVAITNIISRESLIKAVLARVSEKVLVLDRMALDAGFKAVEDSGFQWSMKKDFSNENT